MQQMHVCALLTCRHEVIDKSEQGRNDYFTVLNFEKLRLKAVELKCQ
jgi:hypothetical protein